MSTNYKKFWGGIAKLGLTKRYDRLKTGDFVPGQTKSTFIVIYGQYNGSWWIGKRRRKHDWHLGISHKKKLILVLGANQYSDGFRIALREILDEHQEILNYKVMFEIQTGFIPTLVEGSIPVWRIIKYNDNLKNIEWWTNTTFYHVTPTRQVMSIMKFGLCPRVVTKIDPTYGKEAPSRPNIVYLAIDRMIAHDIARRIKIEYGRDTSMSLLSVRGIYRPWLVPDEDSRKKTAEESIYKMGTFGHIGCIHPSKLIIIKHGI